MPDLSRTPSVQSRGSPMDQWVTIVGRNLQPLGVPQLPSCASIPPQPPEKNRSQQRKNGFSFLLAASGLVWMGIFCCFSVSFVEIWGMIWKKKGTVVSCDWDVARPRIPITTQDSNVTAHMFRFGDPTFTSYSWTLKPWNMPQYILKT